MSTPEPPPYPGDPAPGSASDLPTYGSVPPPPEVPGTPGPPPPPPPAPPAAGPSEFSAPEAILWGWRKFSQDVGPVLLGSISLIGISIVIGFVTSLATGASAFGPGAMEFSNFRPIGLISNIIQTTVSFVLGGVAAKAALEVTQGQPYNFFAAFGKVNFGRLIVASLILSVAVTIGLALLFVPGIIIVFLTFLTTYSLVDDDKEPIEAIKHSFELVTANVGNAILLALLSFLVVVAGAIALCVGILVAIPITTFATAYAYRSFTGQPVAA